MEIERKYLVARLPEGLSECSGVEIEQCYLCTSPTMRIRRMGDVFVLTVKEHIPVGSTAIHNREEEFVMPRESYELLKAKCEGYNIVKTRYRIPLQDGLVAELDIFHGHHEGLRIVEVEFPDTATADRFAPPSWFGDDVSLDPRYRNSYLSRHQEFNSLVMSCSAPPSMR